MTIRYVVFTQEELDAIKEGKDIKTVDQDGTMLIYTNNKKFEDMIYNAGEKEYDDV